MDRAGQVVWPEVEAGWLEGVPTPGGSGATKISWLLEKGGMGWRTAPGTAALEASPWNHKVIPERDQVGEDGQWCRGVDVEDVAAVPRRAAAVWAGAEGLLVGHAIQ